VNSSVKAAVAAVLLFSPALAPVLAPAPASATLTVTPTLLVHNRCGVEIIIAIHYKGRNGWETSPFVNVHANEQKDDVVSSENSIFYYYAQDLSDKPKARWAGDQNHKVNGKDYPMKKTTLVLDRRSNSYRLELSCPPR
jgi:uncharacterized membrane protein